MTDLQTASVSVAATPAQVAKEFLRWWKQHLYECIPLSLRERIAMSRRPAMWSPSDDRYWPAAGALADSKPFSHSALAQRGGDAALVIGETNGFRRVVELPLAVEARLAEVISYEIDRLTPLRATDLYYDFHVVWRNPAAGLCRVELVAAPRTRVAPMIEVAASRNLTVTRMLLAADDVDTGLDLLKNTRDEDEAADRYGWLTPLLAGICVLLALALVAFPLWQLRQQVIDLMPVEAKARGEAEVANVLLRQLEKQVAEYNLPLSRKHASPMVIQVLDDLSKRLPEDTWAQSLEIRPLPNQKTREVVIQGETGSGGKLLQIVQESPLIKDPAFKATMTRVAPNAERFHIAGELVVAEMPKQIQLSDAAAVTTVQVAPTSPAGAPASSKTGSLPIASTPGSAAAVSPAGGGASQPVAPSTAAVAPAPASPALGMPVGDARKTGTSPTVSGAAVPVPAPAAEKKP